mmetsp:Transcript_19525/g.47163  ORF Transcript_19525/g.47163 Transcript_19525/m.47163 type:complete len:489 (-) Transcript_19525:186-1652(-)
MTGHDAILQSLAEKLASAQSAQELSLAYLQIGDAGCPQLAAYISQCPTLKRLDVRGCNIRGDGLAILAPALRSSAIESFTCKWNEVGTSLGGIQALAEACRDHPTLTSLDLRNNKLTTDFAQVLSDMLASNTVLQYLDLSWNELGPEGGRTLQQGIQANKSLRDCPLNGNRISDDTMNTISYLLRRNRLHEAEQDPLQVDPFMPGGEHFCRTTADRPKELQRDFVGMDLLPAPSRAPNSHREPAQPTGNLTHDLDLRIAIAPLGETPQILQDSIEGARQPARNHTGKNESWWMSNVRTLVIESDQMALKVLEREKKTRHPAEAALLREVADYIEKLQMDVAKNKKHRVDSEGRERVVANGFVERESRFAAELREMEVIGAKARDQREDLQREVKHLQSEIRRTQAEIIETNKSRDRFEKQITETLDQLRMQIKNELGQKADCESELYKVQVQFCEEEEENQKMRRFLSQTKGNLDTALRDVPQAQAQH